MSRHPLFPTFLVVLLLANGWNMTRIESGLRLANGDAESGWRGMRMAAVASLML